MKYLNVSYETWKQIVLINKWNVYHKVNSEDEVDIWSGNSEYVYKSIADDEIYLDWEENFISSSVKIEKEDDAEARIIGLNILKETPKSPDGLPKVISEPRRGSEVIYSTHNFCDPTTWYSESQRITGSLLTFNTSSMQWKFQHNHLVDLTHGKIFDEEGISLDQTLINENDQHGYNLNVYVNGELKQERPAFEDNGGDYLVDYISGTIISSSWSSNDIITADYNTQNGSAWILEPTPNKALSMEKAEIQFSEDIQMTDAFRMEVLAYAAIFAPNLIQSNGGPLLDNARIPITQPSTYKTIDQIIDEAINSYPEIIPLSSQTNRGYKKKKIIFQFHYGTVRQLYSSLGMQVKISLLNNRQYLGERATATFYCVSNDDPGINVALLDLGITNG